MMNNPNEPLRITRALFSVWDKEGIERLATTLSRFGCEIISTGGTARYLQEKGLEIVRVEDLTDFPSIFSGRVKTLHPVIFGGILMRTNNPVDQKEAETHKIQPIQLVVIDFYPFEQAREKEHEIEKLLEYIDIGGPSMVRAAAKNYPNVAVLCYKEDLDGVVDELNRLEGRLSLLTRKRLAYRAFAYTAYYDSLIWRTLLEKNSISDNIFPTFYTAGYKKVMDLRYGENPHQKAALYKDPISISKGLIDADVLWGKQLSYNNMVDADACLQLILEFDRPCCAILKHTNPCGLSVGKKSAKEAFESAFECDPVSSFGGIVGFNHQVDLEAAKSISKIFVEIVLAPSFTEDALSLLKQKKNLRIVRYHTKKISPSLSQKSILGGLLVQEIDTIKEDVSQFSIPTKKKPDEKQWADLMVAYRAVKHVKSNAIVIAKDGLLIGVGAGQMSRVESAELAIKRSRVSTEGAVAASDAFFPFRDGVDVLCDAGISAIIQPGGSIRDSEVISAADERGISMVLTGHRHFRH